MALFTSKPMADFKSYFTMAQIQMMIEAAEPRDRMLLLVLSRTGRRVTEVVGDPRKKVDGLRPCDIDWENSLIAFTQLKRKYEKARPKILVPAPRHLMAELDRYIKENKIEYTQRLFEISRQRVDQIVKKYASKIGIESLGSNKYNKPHAHQFRHSFAVFASKKLKNPEDLRKLQQILGHATIDITTFYLQFNPIEIRDLQNRLWDDPTD